MQGWRTTMEDDHCHTQLENDIYIFGVYDGHGGKEAAIYVAKNLPIEIKKNSSYKQGNYEKALKETYLALDRIMDTSADQNYWDNCGAGCTAVTALIHKNILYVANAGDSRCVLSRGGRAVDLTKDHKPDLEIERNRIIKAGGQVVEGRVNGNLNLSRSIGDLEYKRNKSLSQEEQMITANPDLKVIQLTPEDDFLILACDGIWDVMSTQDSVDFVSQRIRGANKLSKICEEMLDACLATDIGTSCGIGCDNMTLIIVQFK